MKSAEMIVNVVFDEEMKATIEGIRAELDQMREIVLTSVHLFDHPTQDHQTAWDAAVSAYKQRCKEDEATG